MTQVSSASPPTAQHPRRIAAQHRACGGVARNLSAMKCSCGWEGELATVTHMEKDWQFTSKPLCLTCRARHRQELRDRGIAKNWVVPCRL